MRFRALERNKTMGLSQIIRQGREKLGLTQDQVAEVAGISKPYLSNIETGKAKNPPTDGILRALERALEFEDGQLQRLAHLERTPMDVRQEHEMLQAEVQKLRSVVKKLMTDKLPATESPSEDREPVDVQSLLQSSDTSNVQSMSAGVTVPIINKVAAGYPHDFTDLDYPPSVADEYIRCPDVHDPQAFAARVVGDSMEPDYSEGDVVIFSPNTVAQPGDDCFVRLGTAEGTTFKRVYQDDPETIRLQPLNSAYASQVFSRDEVTGLWPSVYRIERICRR